MWKSAMWKWIKSGSFPFRSTHKASDVASKKVALFRIDLCNRVSGAQARRVHDGLDALHRLGAPGIGGIGASGGGQQILRAVLQQGLIGVVHQRQLVGKGGLGVVAHIAQPRGGGGADLLGIKARVDAPVQQLDGACTAVM